MVNKRELLSTTKILSAAPKMGDYTVAIPRMRRVGQSNVAYDQDGNLLHSYDNPLTGRTTVTTFIHASNCMGNGSPA